MVIALIAHDGKKPEMVSFAMKNEDALMKANLSAIGTTGKRLKDTGLKVTNLFSVPIRGDAQIAAKVATGEIEAVIFFGDLVCMQPHELDVSMLKRICDVHNVPLAAIPATATLIVKKL